MPERYDPNSIHAVLGKILQKQEDQGTQLDRIEQNQAGLREGQVKLWKAHTSLKTKVAGISFAVGLAVTVATEWLRSIFERKQ